jgi:hypothetical protein
MTDDDLMTMVRNSFTPVHVTTSVEQITRRGRAQRHAHRPAEPSVPTLPSQPVAAAQRRDAHLVIVLDIHPSALPSGTGLQLASTLTLLPPVTTNGGTQRTAHTSVATDLVYASPQCTG